MELLVMKISSHLWVVIVIRYSWAVERVASIVRGED
jgi:hypothetical protein